MEGKWREAPNGSKQVAKEQLDERYDRRTGRYVTLYKLSGADETEKDKFAVETTWGRTVVEAAGFDNEAEARSYQETGRRGVPGAASAEPV